MKFIIVLITSLSLFLFVLLCFQLHQSCLGPLLFLRSDILGLLKFVSSMIAAQGDAWNGFVQVNLI